MVTFPVICYFSKLLAIISQVKFILNGMQFTKKVFSSIKRNNTKRYVDRSRPLASSDGLHSLVTSILRLQFFAKGPSRRCQNILWPIKVKLSLSWAQFEVLRWLGFDWPKYRRQIWPGRRISSPLGHSPSCSSFNVHWHIATIKEETLVFRNGIRNIHRWVGSLLAKK